MRGMLGSYRWRRRFAWIGGFVLLAIGAVVAAILLPKDEGRKYQLAPTGTTPAQTEAAVTKQVRVTAADRRAVNRTLVAFVRPGVTRADPAAAWALSTPAMHSAGTRKDWNGGQLPVLPFPAQISDHPSWNVLSSYPGDLTIDLILQPRPGAKRGPIAFAVELKKATAKGPWLVDSMIPEQGFAPTQPAAKGKKTATTAAPALTGKLSPRWFILPGVLLALIALIPVGYLLNNWRRHRAIERRYRAERGL